MHEVEGVGEAVLLPVDDDVDVVLAEEVHILRAMARHPAKAQPLQLRHKARRMGGAGDEFDELHARHLCGRRKGAADRQRGGRGLGPALVQRLAADFQRAHAVARDGGCGRAAKLVVEDFKGDRAIVARADGQLEEIRNGPVALAGKAAVMAREGHGVHEDARRIRHLHQRDLVAGDLGHGRDGVLAHEGVERVQHHAQIRSVGAAHDVPGLHPVMHMAAPGEGLETNSEAPARGEIGQLREVGAGALGLAKGVFGDIGADAQELGAQLLHQVELALGAVEIAGAHGLGHALEIAHGLQRDDFEAQILRHGADFARLAAEEGEIVLENLDGAEARAGGGRQLHLKRSSHADRGDGPSQHRGLPFESICNR